MARRKKSAAVGKDATSPEDVRLGRALRSARDAAGRNQQDLGALLGISHQQISKYERGASSLTVTMLVRIATYLNTPAEAFLRAIGDQPGFGEAQRPFEAGSLDRDVEKALDRLVDLRLEARKHLS